MKKIISYLKGKNKKLFEYNFGRFQVFIQDPLPETIDVAYVFEEVKSLLPDHFIKLVDVVYVGDFSFFKERKINAMYLDGGLYISNDQDNNEDMKDDIVHEISHAVEDKYREELYEDEEIKNEYFGKLKKLKNYLSYEGYDIRGIDFFNTTYNKKFDDFLSNDVGYEKLSGFIKGLFLAPYSVTSLREYFGRGFEEYFLGNRVYLSKRCPYLYKKLSILSNSSEEYNHEHSI